MSSTDVKVNLGVLIGYAAINNTWIIYGGDR